MNRIYTVWSKQTIDKTHLGSIEKRNSKLRVIYIRMAWGGLNDDASISQN